MWPLWWVLIVLVDVCSDRTSGRSCKNYSIYFRFWSGLARFDKDVDNFFYLFSEYYGKWRSIALFPGVSVLGKSPCSLSLGMFHCLPPPHLLPTPPYPIWPPPNCSVIVIPHFPGGLLLVFFLSKKWQGFFCRDPSPPVCVVCGPKFFWMKISRKFWENSSQAWVFQ